MSGHVSHRDTFQGLGVRDVEKLPVPYFVVERRVSIAEPARQSIYVGVLRGSSGQDDPDGRRGHGQRRDRGALGYAPRGRQRVAQALLPRSNSGARGETPPGTPPGFSPQSWSLRSRRLPARFQRTSACRCRDSVRATSRCTRSARALSRASVAAPSGAGCTRMRYARGSIVAESSRVTRSSSARPNASSTCTDVAGKARRCARTSSSSRPTRRPASRRGFELIRACLARRESRCASSTSTNAVALGHTSPQWTFIGSSCLAAANQRPASSRLSDWSIRL